jgi:hypothetical protein
MLKPALKGLIAALICLFMMAGTSLAANPPKVAKDKNGNPQLMVFNKATGKYEGFMVKAVAYKPQPIGEYKHPSNAKGAQLCYDVPAPWNKDGNYDIVSPCYDSDYFGHMVTIQGKTVADNYERIWDRDLAVLKQMGVNTVRLYDANPQFRNHLPFLNACYMAGIKVIYPLWITTETMSKGWPVTDRDHKQYPGQLPLMDGIKKQIDELGKHEAILCFVAGNEVFDVPFNPNQQYIIDRINMVMDYVSSKSRILVTTCPPDMGDDPNNWSWYYKTFPEAGLVMANAGYRGDACTSANSYGRLWDILDKVIAPSLKFFILGEYGVHDQDDAKYNRRHFNCFLKSADQNMIRTRFMGVVYFEYIDEANKPTNQKEMGVLTPTLATTVPSNRVADKLSPKKANYPGIGSGRWEMFQPYKSGDPAVAKYNYHDIWNQ